MSMPTLLLLAQFVHWALSAALLVIAGFFVISADGTWFAVLCFYEAIVFFLAGVGFHRQHKINGPSIAQALATESAAISLAALGLAVGFFVDGGNAHGSFSDIGVLFSVLSVVFGLFGGGYYVTLWAETKRTGQNNAA